MEEEYEDEEDNAEGDLLGRELSDDLMDNFPALVVILIVVGPFSTAYLSPFLLSLKSLSFG